MIDITVLLEGINMKENKDSFIEETKDFLKSFLTEKEIKKAKLNLKEKGLKVVFSEKEKSYCILKQTGYYSLEYNLLELSFTFKKSYELSLSLSERKSRKEGKTFDKDFFDRYFLKEFKTFVCEKMEIEEETALSIIFVMLGYFFTLEYLTCLVLELNTDENLNILTEENVTELTNNVMKIYVDSIVNK